MKNKLKKTGEQLVLEKIKSTSEYLMYLRHLSLYTFSKKFITSSSIILDAGCGEGFGANLLAGKAKKVIAIDANKQAISHAKSKYQKNNLKYQFADAVNLPFKDNTFNFIISSHVIEHIRNTCKYLNELKRVLKPNAVLIIATPNRIHRLSQKQKPWNRFHVREYSSKQLNNLLKTHFKESKLYGVEEPRETRNIELRRIKKIIKLIKLDPLGLRKLLPFSIKELIKKLLKKEKKPKKYSIDFFKITDYENKSLELIAIMKK